MWISILWTSLLVILHESLAFPDSNSLKGLAESYRADDPKLNATADILEKYKQVLANCNAQKNLRNYVKQVGMFGATIVTSPIDPLGMTGFLMDVLIPSGDDSCYMGKMQSMLMEIMDGKISEYHVNVLISRIKGYKRDYNNAKKYSHDLAKYEDKISILDSIIRTDYPTFKLQKAFAAIPMRDYLLMKVGLFEEMMALETDNPQTLEAHKNQLVGLIIDTWDFIEEAINEAAKFKQNQVYSKVQAVYPQGCSISRSCPYDKMCKCGDTCFSNTKYCAATFEPFWFIPQDASKTRYRSQSKAKVVAARKVQSDLNDALPWEAWRVLLKKYCDPASNNPVPENCRTAKCKVETSIRETCGYGLQGDDCTSKPGCCFDNRIYESTWCYKQA